MLDPVVVDLARRVVRRDGVPDEPLTSLEADLLRYLREAEGRPVSREELLVEVWGYADTSLSRAVDSLVRRLRTKVESDPARPTSLLTVHGKGYQLVTVDTPAPNPVPPPTRPGATIALPDRRLDLARGAVVTADAEIRLTGNELDLLEVLLAAPGAAMDRDALARRVWGSAVGRALEHTVSRLRRKLEADPATPRTLLTTARGYRLAVGEAPPPRPPALHPDPIPPELDRGFGRAEFEADVIARLVGGERLVTLVGLGGAGKSRSAAAVARSLAADGWRVGWAALEGSSDPGDVGGALARTLGLSPGTGAALVAEALDATPTTLVVLDNAEHLLDGVRSVLVPTLGATREARFLVTSRVPLSVRPEVRIAMPPLASADGVALFLDRATRPVTDPELAEVTAVVDALDGSPLAIELAAARTRVLPVSELRVQLAAAGLRVLSAGGPDRPERHRSAEAALAGTWTGLSAPARDVLAQLTVFEGGFLLDAASRVVEVAEGTWLPELLHELLDASVLRLDQRGRRWSMAGIVREAAARHLADGRGRAEERHATVFADLGGRLWSTSDARSVHEARADLDNLQRAARWAIERRSPSAGGAVLGVFRISDLVGPVEGVGDLLAQAARAELAPLDRARVALATAQVHLRAGRHDEAVRAAAGVAGCGDPGLEARAILCSVRAWLLLDRVGDAEAELARVGPTARDEAATWFARGAVLRRRDDPQAAQGAFEQAARTALVSGDPRLAAEAHAELGAAASFANRLEDLERHHRLALLYAEDAGDRQIAGRVQMSRLWNLALRNRPAAREGYVELVGWFRQLGAREQAAWCLTQLVILELQLSAQDAAERAWVEAARLAKAGISQRMQDEIARLEGEILLANGRPQDALDRLAALVDGAVARGDHRLRYSVEYLRSVCLRRLGRVEDTKAALGHALEAARGARAPVFEGEVLLALARSATPEEAETAWRTALAHGEACGLARVRVRAAQGLARWALDADRPDEARACLDAVEELLAGLADRALVGVSAELRQRLA